MPFMNLVNWKIAYKWHVMTLKALGCVPVIYAFYKLIDWFIEPIERRIKKDKEG